jgi:hypothetical protein
MAGIEADGLVHLFLGGGGVEAGLASSAEVAHLSVGDGFPGDEKLRVDVVKEPSE